jgi:uncharacterized protein
MPPGFHRRRVHGQAAIGHMTMSRTNAPSAIAPGGLSLAMRYLYFLLLLTAAGCGGSRKPGNMVHPFRLKPGQDLKQEIENYAKAHHLQAGYVITCAGSLTQYHLRYANQPEGVKGTGHFEIVSLTGTVSVNGCHLHASIADSTGRVTGGHLLEGNLIYTTAEIVLGESDAHIFTREKDGTTPWDELQVKEKE